MKIENIEVGMRVEVYTSECGDKFKGEVILIDDALPYSIGVNFGWATECFKPEDLEEY